MVARQLKIKGTEIAVFTAGSGAFEVNRYDDSLFAFRRGRHAAAHISRTLKTRHAQRSQSAGISQMIDDKGVFECAAAGIRFILCRNGTNQQNKKKQRDQLIHGVSS